MPKSIKEFEKWSVEVCRMVIEAYERDEVKTLPLNDGNKAYIELYDFEYSPEAAAKILIQRYNEV